MSVRHGDDARSNMLVRAHDDLHEAVVTLEPDDVAVAYAGRRELVGMDARDRLSPASSISHNN